MASRVIVRTFSVQAAPCSSKQSVRLAPAAPRPRQPAHRRSQFTSKPTATSEGQQQGQQQSSQPPPPPSPPPPPFAPQALRKYDGYIKSAKEGLEFTQAAIEDLDEQLARMPWNAPQWFPRFLRWQRGVCVEQLAESRKQYDRLVAKREQFEEGLRQLERQLQTENAYMVTSSDVLALVVAQLGSNWALQEDGDGSKEELEKMLAGSMEVVRNPDQTLWGAVVVSLGLAYLLAWVGSWWDVDAYRLLHQAPNLAASAPAWLAWTAPYVGGTLLAHSRAPQLFDKSVLRVIAVNQQQFFRNIPTYSFLFAAFTVSFSQCLVWQGLWQDALVSWMGGSRNPLLLTDPYALQDGISASMGTLVGSPRLPAFVVAPGAALLVGLLEGATFWAVTKAMDKEMWIEMFQDDADWKDTVADLDLELGRPSVFTPDELPQVAARIGLAGSYLALEATLTGSLWLSVGTSMAGLVIVILLSRRT